MMTTTRALLILIAAAASAPASAQAGSRAAKNRCNDAVMILRSNPSKHYEREEVDPLDAGNAKKHRAQVVDGITRAKAKLDQVPAGELDPKDPDLAECFSTVNAWNDYLAKLDGKIKIAEEQGKVFVPFLAANKPRERSFIAFLSIAANPAGGAFDNKGPADLKKALAELVEVDAACGKIPAEYRDPPADYDGKMPAAKLVQRPFAWCRVAKNRAMLATEYLAKKTYHAEGYGAYGIVVPETIEKLASGNGFMEAWVAAMLLDPSEFRTKVRASAKGWYDAAGIAMPADAPAGVDELVAKLKARVDEVAPTLKFQAGPRAPAIEKGAQASLVKIYPKAKVVAAAMDAADFEIRKNALDVPTERFRSGQIVFKLPGTTHCVQRTFSYVETYKGGGKYQKPSKVDILGATRFLKCP